MLFFPHKKTVSESGFFDGFTDFHSHILPGVDDGFSSMEESLAILAGYEEAGVSELWLTPHIMEDMPNTTDELKARYSELVSAYAADRLTRGSGAREVKLHLASENMLDGVLEKRLETKDFLPMPGGRLLVETSYYNPPFNFYGLIDRIKSAGFFPILAHPERYIYMVDADYSALRARGVLFQLNFFSLLGYYGSAARAKALHLLDNSFYSFVGTDLHRAQVFDSALKEKIDVKTLDKVKEICF